MNTKNIEKDIKTPGKTVLGGLFSVRLGFAVYSQSLCLMISVRLGLLFCSGQSDCVISGLSMVRLCYWLLLFFFCLWSDFVTGGLFSVVRLCYWLFFFLSVVRFCYFWSVFFWSDCV